LPRCQDRNKQLEPVLQGEGSMNIFEEGLQKYLTPVQINRLQKVKVGIAGAGGLGSNCAAFLVRAGFCRFLLVDFDVVEPANLNRQFYFADQVGQKKVDALRENLLRINPDLSLEIRAERITRKNVKSLFADVDVAVEALDAAETKRFFTEACLEMGKFTVAASGIAGWGNTDAIRTREINAGFVLIGDLQTEVAENVPPLAPRVTIAAAKEADAVLSAVLPEKLQA